MEIIAPTPKRVMNPAKRTTCVVYKYHVIRNLLIK
jgi:hypothetical protein